MSQSPIGALMVEATTKSKNKANGHTSIAGCGCEVLVARFGSGSQRIAPSPCAEHNERPAVPTKPTKRGGRARKVEVEV